MQTIQTAVSPGRSAGSTIKSHNPATGEVIGEVPVRSADEVRAAVARATAAQESWGLLSVRERCRRLAWFRDALVTRADEVAELLSRETGKPRVESLTHELFVVADLIS